MPRKERMNPMRLLICAGGTGGGVYPALAVLQTETNKSTRVLWVGSDDGLEADLVKRAGIAYLGIPAAGLHGVNILSIPKRLFKLAKGYIAAKKIIREYKPDVMFFTGGYVGFPVALAGRKIPSVLFVPDIEPGVALNMLSKKADLLGFFNYLLSAARKNKLPAALRVKRLKKRQQIVSVFFMIYL